ncbi:hypothetical protein [Streptomyces sp. MNP-20]|uniref:hypothetical protein n=1 Tax=Streptomyces sp. MNP-20 TaxID=2721165 RepID=UPI0015566BC7|nr:hypothetical protein [Streptomyces sp. MNP-20]
MGQGNPAVLPLVSTVVAEAFDRWSPPLHEDFEKNAHNGRVGSSLLAETASVRIWETRLGPGERIPVHRHVLDYVWIALTSGRARQHLGDGSSREIAYERGHTQRFRIAEGAFHLHDMRNIGEEVLSFLVIEEKDGPNEPLELTGAQRH